MTENEVIKTSTNGHADHLTEIQRLKTAAVQQAQTEIAQVCAKYGVRLVPVCVIREGHIEQTIQLVSE
jgi:hypothetical protein